MKDKSERFVAVSRQHIKKSDSVDVLVDTMTGVQYLYAWCGSGAGITVLVDEDGKPLVSEELKRTE